VRITNTGKSLAARNPAIPDGRRGRVRERVLADQPIALNLAGEEPHAHRGRRHGANGRHRLRHDHLSRGRGDRQFEDALLGPALDLDHEVEARDPVEVPLQAANQEVVVRGDRAGDATSGRNAVLADAEALARRSLQERRAHHYGERALVGQPAHSVSHRQDTTQDRAAGVALE